MLLLPPLKCYFPVPPGALVYQGSAQSIAPPDASLLFSQEVYDEADRHSQSSNTNLLRTLKSDFVVRLLSGSEMAAGSSQNLLRHLFNGAESGKGRGVADTGNQSNTIASALVEVADPGNDYFETFQHHNSAGSISTVAARTWAAIEAVDPALKRCLLHKTATQAMGAGANVVVTWGAATYDRGGFWSAASPTRLTVPASGYYRVGGSFEGQNVTGQCVMTFLVNGAVASVRGVPQRDNDTAGADFLNCWSAPVFFNAGDYIELNVLSTTAQTMQVTDVQWFAIEEIADHKKALIYKSANQSMTAATLAQVVLGGTVYDPDGMKSGNTLVVPAGCSWARPTFGIVTPSATGIEAARIRLNGADYTGNPRFDTDTAGTDSCSGMGPWVPVTPGDAFSLWFQPASAMTLADHNGLFLALECR